MNHTPLRPVNPASPLQESRIGWMVLAFVVPLLVYSGSLFNGFVFDDQNQILDNPWIRDVRSLRLIFFSNVWAFQGRGSDFYRPMMHVIYMGINYVFGTRPWAFHLINILMHCTTSALVFLTILRLQSGISLSSRRPQAFAAVAALVFALHPVNTEAVAWAAAVPDLSSALFFMLSLYLYIVAAERQRLRAGIYALSVMSFFMATLCKEPSLTLPAVLFVYDMSIRREGMTRSSLFKRYAPFAFAMVLYFILRTIALKGFTAFYEVRPSSLYETTVKMTVLFAAYLGKLLVPLHLTIYHNFQSADSFFTGKGAVGLAVTATFMVFAWLAYKRDKVALLGICILVLPLLPAVYVMALNRLLESPMPERYLYLPCVGFALLVSLAAERLSRRIPVLRTPLTIVLVCMLAAYSSGAVLRTKVWHDDYALWSDAVKKEPEAAKAHESLGYALLAMRMNREGIAEFRRAGQLDPSTAERMVEDGIMFSAAGQIDRAIFRFHAALVVDPTLFSAHYNLGVAYERKGWVEQAMMQYQTAIALKPDFAPAYNNLGILYANKREIAKAVENFQFASKLDPSHAGYRTNLEKALREGR